MLWINHEVYTRLLGIIVGIIVERSIRETSVNSGHLCMHPSHCSQLEQIARGRQIFEFLFEGFFEHYLERLCIFDWGIRNPSSSSFRPALLNNSSFYKKKL